jgi:predicted ArsR family transcriptional regulator
MKLTTDKLLHHLKRFGEQPAAKIAESCGVSPVSVRNHLATMLPTGLVSYREVRAGQGRPRRLWQLTSGGHARFVDRHADLATQLIEHVDETLGRATLDRVLCARQKHQQEMQDSALANTPKLASRLLRLLELREGEGFMPRVMKSGARDWLFVQDHCPIRAAATVCPQLCASELELMRRAVADQADVHRVEHLMKDGKRCVYLIARRSD